MMTRLKSDLEKELDANLKNKPLKVTKSFLSGSSSTESSRKALNISNQQESQLRSQIKHLDDQMRCVVFLLMQCQIGLENCNETFNQPNCRSSKSEETPEQKTEEVLNENTLDKKATIEIRYEDFDEKLVKTTSEF